MKIEAEINLDWLREQIEKATELTGDEEFFEQLSAVEVVKKQLKDVEDQIKTVEAEAKGMINARAKALYGNDWQVISGKHVKITRSKTGDVYTINGTPSAKFVKVKKSVDSKLVDEYVVKNSKLPKGIEINDKRGESLRITVK
jgi:hypothetical protein